ncbi:MAG: thiamine phosphate synthase [Gorillibacterium sp.]|nr:thiamine phosphate synthase [Gorillibacterium sp.]
MKGYDRERLRAQLQVYFIMGSNNCLSDDPVRVLADAIAGGATLFQYREKGPGALTGTPMHELAFELRALCQKHAIPFIVNDDLELTLELNADGIHIGQEDMAAAIVRQKIGPDRILGVSAYNREEAKAAMEQGADYLGVGPIYDTTTKEDAKNASGLVAIHDILRSGITLPIVGIGGITVDNAADIIQAGADGVSVITAISHANDPYNAAEVLSRIVAKAKLG